MRVLTADIGTGTQDILLFDSEKEAENSLVLVMPSPTQIIAEKIKKATDAGKAIVLTGNLMGGGPCAKAIKTHLREGLSVYATKKAALTLHDSLEKVQAFGVQLVSEEEARQILAGRDTKNIPKNKTNDENIPKNRTKDENIPKNKTNNISKNNDNYQEGEAALEIVMRDFDPEAVSAAFTHFGVELPSNLALALQDHGESPDKSNRVYRFELMREFIDKGGELKHFVYTSEEIPQAFTRIRAQAKALEESLPGTRAVFMDTGPAAIFGGLLDPAAAQPSLVVNIGNGHTLGAVVLENRVTALFEHHTSRLDAKKLQDYIIRLADGKLGFEEVFEDMGHGAYIKEAPGFSNIRSVMVTGPKRELLEKLPAGEIEAGLVTKLHFAAPFGNMMLSGSFGLLKGFLEKYPEPSVKLSSYQ